MTANRVVAVFGVSGVGKTWLAERLAAERGMRHVSAGALMRMAKQALEGQAATAEDLRTGAVLDNQAILLRAFGDLRATEQRDILFDGHSLVDTDTGLVTIPTAVIEGLRPSGMVFVQGEPEDIAARRAADATRQRPVRSPSELRHHQAVALEVCEGYRQALGIPLFIVKPGAAADFAASVAAIVDPPRD